MKNTFVRLFVLALASTGFAAATVTAHSDMSTKVVASATHVGIMPVPMCLPSSGGRGCW